MIAQASELLGEARDARPVLEAIARLVVPRLGDHCLIDAVDEEGRLVRVAEASVDPESEALLRRLRRFPPNTLHTNPALKALQTGCPQVIDPVDGTTLAQWSDDPEYRAIVMRIGPTSSISVPATARGRVLAVITFGMDRSGRVHAPEDVEFAERLARQAALALDSQRLYEAERRARGEAERTAERLKRLERLTSALSTALTPTQVAEAVLEHGMPAVGATAGCVGVVDETGQALDMLAFRGFPEEVERGWARIPLDVRIPLTTAVQTGKPVLVEDREGWRHESPVAFRAHSGIEALAALPLAAHGKILGAISFSLEDARRVTDADRPLMGTLADQCALALDRAQLQAAEHRALEAERLARTEAERALAARDELLALVSHDLRTPLGTVNMAATLLAESLREGHPDHDQVGAILRAATTMDRLIEDLVDLARLEGGHLELSCQPEAVAPLIDDVCALLRPQAESRGQRIEQHVSDPSLRVHCDRRRVAQILTNLMTNAIKFTPAGERVLVGARPVDGAVEIWVRDSGPGLSAEARRRMFDRFWTAAPSDGAGRATPKGLGLGLTIVRGLVEAHGSQVEVQSTTNHGTEMRFRLQSL
jgi:signal transduction histidine kinase